MTLRNKIFLRRNYQPRTLKAPQRKTRPWHVRTAVWLSPADTWAMTVLQPRSTGKAQYARLSSLSSLASRPSAQWSLQPNVNTSNQTRTQRARSLYLRLYVFAGGWTQICNSLGRSKTPVQQKDPTSVPVKWYFISVEQFKQGASIKKNAFI